MTGRAGGPVQDEAEGRGAAGGAPPAVWDDVLAPSTSGPGAPDLPPAEARYPGPLTVIDCPTRTDPVVRSASAVIGGPVGDRMALGRSRFGPGGGLLWITLVLALLSAVTLGLGVLQKQHCANQGWTTPDQFWHACYSDIAVLYGSEGLGTKDAPTLPDAVGPDGLGQPPLASAAMWTVSKLVSSDDKAGARTFFDLSAMLLAGALGVAVAAVAAAAGRRPWDAAQLALTPVLVTVGLISYDLLAVALLASALLLWARRVPVLDGVLLGLAIATRPTTAAVLMAVLALSIRTGRPRPLLTFGVPALATWLGLRVILMPGLAGGFAKAYETWREAGPGYGSIWMIPGLISQAQPQGVKLLDFGNGLPASWTTLGVLMALTLVGAATVVIALAVQDRPRLAHLALFAVAGSLLVTKSVPVQAGLVLLPLIALAGLRWRDTLIWATTESVYFVAVWLYIGAQTDPNKGLPPSFYLVLLLARLAGIGWLMIQSALAMRDPLRDPVRVPPDGAPGLDDPIGGPLEGAPDALVLRLA
jgi:uncharacterized membrane protein